MNRRDFLRRTGGIAAGLLFGGTVPINEATQVEPFPKLNKIRFYHDSRIHPIGGEFVIDSYTDWPNPVFFPKTEEESQTQDSLVQDTGFYSILPFG